MNSCNETHREKLGVELMGPEESAGGDRFRDISLGIWSLITKLPEQSLSMKLYALLKEEPSSYKWEVQEQLSSLQKEKSS